VDTIPRVAKREASDLILVGSHGRHKIRDYLLGSTASHLIRRSELPVLVAF
jgi:nucleotide-binding universal stress UspA family protein